MTRARTEEAARVAETSRRSRRSSAHNRWSRRSRPPSVERRRRRRRSRMSVSTNSSSRRALDLDGAARPRACRGEMSVAVTRVTSGGKLQRVPARTAGELQQTAPRAMPRSLEARRHERRSVPGTPFVAVEEIVELVRACPGRRPSPVRPPYPRSSCCSAITVRVAPRTAWGWTGDRARSRQSRSATGLRSADSPARG